MEGCKGLRGGGAGCREWRGREREEGRGCKAKWLDRVLEIPQLCIYLPLTPPTDFPIVKK